MSKRGILRSLKVGAYIGVPVGIIIVILESGFGFSLSILGETTFIGVIGSFLLAFFSSVFFHEIGHSVAFMTSGVSMRGIIVLGFSCIKRKRRWKVRFIPSLLKMMGGIAVPEIVEIYTEEELAVMQDKFARAIKFGPYASIIYAIGVIVSTILLFFTGNESVFMLWFSLFNIVILVLVLYSSNMENAYLVGDFKAYERSIRDRFFVGLMMYQYKYFSEKKDIEQKYLKEYLLKGLERKGVEKDTHAYTLSVVDLLLMEGVLEEDVPKVISNYLDMISEDIYLVKRSIAMEGVKNLIYHMVIYYNRLGDDKAEMLYDIVKNNGGKSKVDQYLLRQVEHAMGIENNADFLSEPKNINLSMLQMLYNQFEGFIELEMAYNRLILNN